jgi:L-aminopeptidase/D-esterase-like protein
MIDHYADHFAKEHAWAMPVVAETYDGVLNDINAMHVTARPCHCRAERRALPARWPKGRPAAATA